MLVNEVNLGVPEATPYMARPTWVSRSVLTQCENRKLPASPITKGMTDT